MTSTFLGNPRVLVIPYSEGKDVMPQGQGVQYEAIYHFLRNYKDRHTWALHIDVDEFVYLKLHKSERSLVTAHGLVSNHWLRPSGPRARHGVPALLLVLCNIVAGFLWLVCWEDWSLSCVSHDMGAGLLAEPCAPPSPPARCFHGLLVDVLPCLCICMNLC
jgi:hypothetical protein